MGRPALRRCRPSLKRKTQDSPMLVSAVSPAAPAATQPRAATAPVTRAPAAGPIVDLAAVKTAVASVKEALKPVGGSLEFNVDQASGKTIVRIVDLDTQ